MGVNLTLLQVSGGEILVPSQVDWIEMTMSVEKAELPRVSCYTFKLRGCTPPEAGYSH